MKKFLCLSVLAAFSLFGALQISAIDKQRSDYAENLGRNSISGFVFSASRQPLPDIYVELLSDLGTTIFRSKTSSAGFYSFRGLPDGRYNVRVLPYNTNLMEETRSVNLISISAIPGSGSTQEQVDFYLRVKKDERDKQLVAPGVVFAQEVPKDAENLYKKGVDLLSEKKDAEGLESLKKSLDIFPDYYLALDRLGTEYVMRGDFKTGKILLTRAIGINPKSFSSNFGLGLANYRLQEIDKSIEHLKKAAEISSDSINAQLWLGIAYLQKKEYSKSEDALLKANKLSGEKSAEVHWQLARLYNEEKKFKQSADELELFLKYNTEARDAEKIKETIAVLRKKADSK